MPFRMNWDDQDDTILVIRIDSPASWNDYHRMFEHLRDITQDLNHRFDVVSVMNAPMPRGNPIPHFQRMNRFIMQHPHLGLYVTVRPGQANVAIEVARAMIQVAGLSMPRSEFAQSTEAAHERIQRNRQQGTAAE